MSEKEYIALCKQKIEARLNLNSSHLSERDYEYMHRVLFEETKTHISTSTLRRLWDDSYRKAPQIQTLNALARLLGYDHWHMFKHDMAGATTPERAHSKKWIYGLAMLVALIGGYVVFGFHWATVTASLTPEVTAHKGVPATIGFGYNVPNGEVEIELSWNPYERTKLDPNSDFYTGTYFYPDYHEAKLLYRDQILASERIHVTTSGWHGLIMDSGLDTRPQYVPEADFVREDRLELDVSTIQRLVPGTEWYPVFTLSNHALDAISGDQFALSAQVKMGKNAATHPCSNYDIVIKGTHGNIRIPVAANGCYGLMTLKCAEQRISGKVNDLSGLTTELSAEHAVRIESKNKALKISIQDNDPVIVEYSGSIGSLRVIKFIFSGPAVLSSFSLLNDQGQAVQSLALFPF